MTATAPGRPNKSQQAYQSLKDRIVRREYLPGYRLVLDRIASELGMSVVPVREAIRALEAENLVTFEPNVGASVSMIDDSQFRNSMQALSVLEGAATALSARVMTAEDVAAARDINEQMTRALDHFDPHTFTELNRRFHGLLFARCANQRLLDLVQAEWVRLGSLRDSIFSVIPRRARGSVREHETILALIEGSAPLDQIERAVREHRSATLDAYIERSSPTNRPA